MGKPRYRQTTVTRSASEMALETDQDLLTTSPATCMCVHSFPLAEENKTFLYHKSIHLGWESTNVVSSPESVSWASGSVRCSPLCFLITGVSVTLLPFSEPLKRNKITLPGHLLAERQCSPWSRQVSHLAATGTANSSLPVAGNQLLECIVLTPSPLQWTGRSDTVPSKGSRARATISPFGSWGFCKPLNKERVGSYKPDQRRPTISPTPRKNHRPLGQKDLLTGLLCWSFWNRPITTFHLGANFFISKGLFSLLLPLFCSNREGR